MVCDYDAILTVVYVAKNLKYLSSVSTMVDTYESLGVEISLLESDG